MRYSVRLMQLGDIPQVAEIERESFPTLPPTSFKRELLDNRIARYIVTWEKGREVHPSPCGEEPRRGLRWDRLLSGVRHFLVGEEPAPTSDHIVGFAGLWFMADEAHLTSIAVQEAYREQGIGELLLIAAIELAVAKNAQFVVLEVRASNLAAQALYEKYGFTLVRVRPGYYTDNREDALVMIINNVTSAFFQAHFQKLKRAYAERWGAIQVAV